MSGAIIALACALLVACGGNDRDDERADVFTHAASAPEKAP